MDHSEGVEADLARYYPRDADQLDRFMAGEMTIRRLWVLVSKLPQGSHTARVMFGEVADWRVGDYHLAKLYNLTLSVNSEKRPAKSDLIQPPRGLAD